MSLANCDEIGASPRRGSKRSAPYAAVTSCRRARARASPAASVSARRTDASSADQSRVNTVAVTMPTA